MVSENLMMIAPH